MGLHISKADRPGFAILDFRRDLGSEDLAIRLQSKLLRFGDYLGDSVWSATPHYFKAVRLPEKGLGVYRIGPEIVNQGGLALDIIEVSVHGLEVAEEVIWPELPTDPNAAPVHRATAVPPEPAPAQEPKPQEPEAEAPAKAEGAQSTDETELPQEPEADQAADAVSPEDNTSESLSDESVNADSHAWAGPEPTEAPEPPEDRKERPEPVVVLKLLPEPLAPYNPRLRYGRAAAATFAATLLLSLAWLFCMPLPFLGSRCTNATVAAVDCAKIGGVSDLCDADQSEGDAARDREAAARVRECLSLKATPPCGADICVVKYLKDFPLGNFRGQLVRLTMETNEQCRILERDAAQREAEERQQAEIAAKVQAEREAAARARAEAEAREKREAEEQQAAIAAKEQAEREAAARARAEAEAREKREAEERQQAALAAKEQAEREAAERARAEADAREKREAEERQQAALAAKEQAEREAAERARTEAEAREKREAEERQQAALAAKEQAEREAAERARAEAEAREKREAEERQQAEIAAKEQAEREAAARARAEADAREKREAEERQRAASQGPEAASISESRPQKTAAVVPDGDYSGRTAREESCAPIAKSVIVTIKDGRVCWDHDMNFSNRWAGTIDSAGVIEARVRGRPGTSATGQIVNGGLMSIEMVYPECANRIRLKLVGMVGAASACP